MSSFKGVKFGSIGLAGGGGGCCCCCIICAEGGAGGAEGAGGGGGGAEGAGGGAGGAEGRDGGDSCCSGSAFGGGCGLTSLLYSCSFGALMAVPEGRSKLALSFFSIDRRKKMQTTTITMMTTPPTITHFIHALDDFFEITVTPGPPGTVIGAAVEDEGLGAIGWAPPKGAADGAAGGGGGGGAGAAADSNAEATPPPCAAAMMLANSSPRLAIGGAPLDTLTRSICFCKQPLIFLILSPNALIDPQSSYHSGPLLQQPRFWMHLSFFASPPRAFEPRPPRTPPHGLDSSENAVRRMQTAPT